MTKYAISSVNENPEYLFFVPIWCSFWRRLGYEPYVITIDKNIPEPLMNLVATATEKVGGTLGYLEHIDGYKTANVAQVSRLFVSANGFFEDDDYLITDDFDKFVMSHRWFNQQDETKDIHIFDLDETNYTRLKIGYVGMKAKVWREVLGIDPGSYRESLTACLDGKLKKSVSTETYRYENQQEKEMDAGWNLDEYVLTTRVFESAYYPDRCHLITRGANRYGLRNGRIDRTFWKETLFQYLSSQIIDVHLHRKPYDDEIWGDIKWIMARAFDEEKIDFFEEYKQNFVRLINE